MRRQGFDKGFWAVVLSAALAVSGMSLTFCPTALAHDPVPAAPTDLSHTPTDASKTALTLQSDDDGNELLEHWSDPKYANEERLQTVGIVTLLACGGGAAAYRRRGLREGKRP